MTPDTPVQMTDTDPRPPFNIAAIAQGGRLQYEALLLAASLRACDPGFRGRLILLEPQPGGAWPEDPRIQGEETREALLRLGAEIQPFHAAHFGASYPQGNKIEALAALPAGEPFLFLDSDTLITGALSDIPFDFDRPSASMRREGTWPEIELYGPGHSAIWKSLYDRFGLDFESSLDLSEPDEFWRRYLYFNAGWFFYRDPAEFGARFLEYARSIRSDPPPELICQKLDPWLDQVALPLVIHSFGGGRPGPELAPLDGSATCHWRLLPLLYARESDRVVEVLEEVSRPNWIKKALKEHDPFKRMIYQGKGERVRAMFDRENLPWPEQKLRNRIKKAKLWMR
ncbi:glycosyltransferase family A protein [Aliiruegeria sabulilitoris]|uniref:glycosyltransferase family A protein n=1 Tax=Aliiruegeria sabulilitoris TaxID=1510458 RepID=UPI001E2A8FC1|nr:glycosyltransferase family A protein [Aliiruegeria sabulilitoris]